MPHRSGLRQSRPSSHDGRAFGILVPLGLLMYLAYRGVDVLLVAPMLALVVVLVVGSTFGSF